jgi:hypothetical protein
MTPRVWPGMTTPVQMNQNRAARTRVERATTSVSYWSGCFGGNYQWNKTILANIAINATMMPAAPTIIEKIEANPPLISGDAARRKPTNPNGIDRTARINPQMGLPEQERNMLPSEASTASIALVPMRCGGRSEY